MFANDHLSPHHQVQLLGVISERVFFEDFEMIFCIQKEMHGDWFSPFKLRWTFDLRRLFCCYNVTVCIAFILLIETFRNLLVLFV